MHIPRPSASMIVAGTALAVALGGTGYAAVSLPRGSVGTAQLKRNAVTSAKVRDGSLTAADFAAGTVARGATGATGAVGPKGDTGARGPSDVFTVTRGSSTFSNAAYTTVTSLTVPAGSFVIQASGDTYISAGTSSEWLCRLNWPASTPPVQTGFVDSTTYTPIAITTIQTFTSSTQVDLQCVGARGSTAGTAGHINVRITALQVGTVTGS
ncbi:MAG: hypothetical protein U0Y82_10260 [Thermoleophilia bacterium]